MNKAPNPPSHRPPGTMRAVVADNIKRRMEVCFEQSTNRPKSLAKEAGMSLSSIQRILSTEQAPTTDALEKIAIALDVAPYQLLLIHLDERNPQIVAGESAAERKFYAALARGR